MTREEYEHAALCAYITANYPAVIFTSDLSGVRLPLGLAKKVKRLRSCNGIPDLIIFEARGGYFGLCLELKAEGAKVYTKEGRVLADPHLQEQDRVHKRLSASGYLATFAVGLVNAQSAIREYMKMPKTTQECR